MVQISYEFFYKIKDKRLSWYIQNLNLICLTETLGLDNESSEYYNINEFTMSSKYCTKNVVELRFIFGNT